MRPLLPKAPQKRLARHLTDDLLDKRQLLQVSLIHLKLRKARHGEVDTGHDITCLNRIEKTNTA
jgi:hypothetical protein